LLRWRLLRRFSSPADQFSLRILCAWLAAAACAATPCGAAERAAGFEAADGASKPAFALPDLTGTSIELAAGHDNLVLVHFFATWCDPCREELPALQRLATRPRSPAAVLAISVGEPDQRVHSFFDSRPVSFPVLLDRDLAVAKGWGVYDLPTTYVLDPALVPRLVVRHDLDWDAPDVAAALEALKTQSAPANTSIERGEQYEHE
jgi:thiol-disulfide isomerase/thioredoxin